jgi:hypothetical protein
MQPKPGGSELNGVEIEQYTCGSTSKIQRFHIYRDVPGSDLVGIQAASSGGMLGSDALEEEEEIRQYDGGMADGSGTFSLVPVGD